MRELARAKASERPGSWIIRRTSCMCGGNWAWMRRRESGAYEMQGCVCHHPWTLALRAGVPADPLPDYYGEQK